MSLQLRRLKQVVRKVSHAPQLSSSPGLDEGAGVYGNLDSTNVEGAQHEELLVAGSALRVG